MDAGLALAFLGLIFNRPKPPDVFINHLRKSSDPKLW